MKNKNLYSRWLKGELTEAERSELKASGELEVLEKIIAETESWRLPEMKESYSSLKEKIETLKGIKQTKVIPLKKTVWSYGIAASVLILLGSVYWFFFSPDIITYQSTAGQTLSIFLPDTTEVILNGHSSISFDNRNWKAERIIELEGEAYFNVSRKGPFRVTFSQAVVNVLGTRFTILSGKDIATVKCYEGKVAVSNKKIEQVLSAGQGVRLFNLGNVDTFMVSSEKAEWIEGETVFKEAPLVEVIDALMVQYDIEFDSKAIDLQRKYTGKFVHKDVETALDMVFGPMGIEYSVETGRKKRVILK